MTAHQPNEPHAGRWVAWVSTSDDYHRRTYLRRFRPDGGVSWSVFRIDALRFDTRAEAERRIRQLVGRHHGQRTGAEKLPAWQEAR